MIFALGGLLKGAIGTGAPVLGVPALAMLYDVKLAVAVMMVPNLVSNLWQIWQYKKSLLPKQFVWSFALAGGAGAGFGSWLLATLPSATLSLVLAATVLAYVIFRMTNPSWVLSYVRALKLSIPVGLVAGSLQGSTGISAPVSVTFFNALQLQRSVFIASISVYFVVMTFVQIPALMHLHILTTERLLLGMAALVPMLAFMPVGEMLAEKISRQTFDRALLLLLVCLALKLAYDGLQAM